LDQDEKENIRTQQPRCEVSELTQEERNLLAWYRAMTEADRGYISRISQALIQKPWPQRPVRATWFRRLMGLRWKHQRKPGPASGFFMALAGGGRQYSARPTTIHLPTTV